MTALRPLACALAAQALLLPAALACGGDYGAPPPPRDVDLVICLDTSGSMEGLIDAARKKLWDVCSLLGQARPTPRLRVALFQYGGDEGAERGHVVRHTDLTTDLDTVYEKLGTLRAQGSDERVGRVLHEALHGLAWSPTPGALRVILVAGNESADQDREHPFRELAKQALQQNAVVHAVYCAREGEEPGVLESWRELARWGGGELAPISLDRAALQVETPHDAELIRLGAALNATYIPFGANGLAGQQRQAQQDENAGSWGGSSSSAARAACKAQSVYRNDGWDLVDASAQPGFEWDKVKKEDLPPGLRELCSRTLPGHVAEVRAERKRIQARIQELTALRQQAIEEELARRQGEAARTLDQALLAAIKKQGQARGLTW